jgi:ACT domain-containing protein
MSEKERIVVTVMGQDRLGIVAGISGVLAENGVNIIDLTSTKMHGLFVMIILAEVEKEKMTIGELQEKLKKKGDELGIQVMAQDETVFRYMHRI